MKSGAVEISKYKKYREIDIFYISPIKSIIIPLMTPILYKSERIIKFSFIFLFDLNSTTKATPLLVNKPAIVEPNEIVLFKYNWVITTEAAQFGINPIMLAINEPNILSFKNNLANCSSAEVCINTLSKRVIMNKNAKVFKVCLIVDLNIPFSQ